MGVPLFNVSSHTSQTLLANISPSRLGYRSRCRDVTTAWMGLLACPSRRRHSRTCRLVRRRRWRRWRRTRAGSCSWRPRARRWVRTRAWPSRSALPWRRAWRPSARRSRPRWRPVRPTWSSTRRCARCSRPSGCSSARAPQTQTERQTESRRGRWRGATGCCAPPSARWSGPGAPRSSRGCGSGGWRWSWSCAGARARNRSSWR